MMTLHYSKVSVTVLVTRWFTKGLRIRAKHGMASEVVMLLVTRRFMALVHDEEAHAGFGCSCGV
jgi:hypothetical protein